MTETVRIISYPERPWWWTVPMAPVLIPPWWVSIQAWNVLSSQQVHPLFKVASVVIIFGAALYALDLFYKYLPMVLTVPLTMAGLAAGWAGIALAFGCDQVWAGGIAAVAAVLGYFAAKSISLAERSPLPVVSG